MNLYATNPQDARTAMCRVTAVFCGQQITVKTIDADFKQTEEYKDMIAGKKTAPLLKTSEGCLHESVAVCKYFCALSNNKLLGSNAIERSQVDQWISFNNTTLVPYLNNIEQAIFGTGNVQKAAYDTSLKMIQGQVKTLNTAIGSKKWLVGDDMTLADVVLACTLMHGFQTVIDAGMRKAFSNLDAWVSRCYSLPVFQGVFGEVKMAAKALKPKIAEPPAKKEEKKKQEPQPKQEKKVDVKPKSNIELLPPSDFNLYDFKTFFINHPDQKGKGMDEAYKMIDWEGWSFWKFEYDIYEGEGAKVHMCNNLLNGFLTRAEGSSKHTFGRHVVLGDEPALQIFGVWLVRGKDEVPDSLTKDHPSFEYYRSKKLDHKNKKDDKLIRAYWGGKEGDVIDGKLKARTLKWHK